MTEAEHADLSRQLALAIGWPEHSVIHTYTSAYVWFRAQWRPFDYRDETIIWRVAERYEAFPWRTPSNEWRSCVTGNQCAVGGTPAEAVALAVIGAKS